MRLRIARLVSTGLRWWFEPGTPALCRVVDAPADGWRRPACLGVGARLINHPQERRCSYE